VILRGLSEEGWMFLRGNFQLVEKGVMPNSLHILPVVDDTVLDRVI
jgi:hypothetical protein